jgi:wobble nucleotide-excising tRNase
MEEIYRIQKAMEQNKGTLLSEDDKEMIAVFASFMGKNSDRVIQEIEDNLHSKGITNPIVMLSAIIEVFIDLELKVSQSVQFSPTSIGAYRNLELEQAASRDNNGLLEVRLQGHSISSQSHFGKVGSDLLQF